MASLPSAGFTAVRAVGGITTAGMRVGFESWLAGLNAAPSEVFIGLGSNDTTDMRAGTLTEAAWSADMGFILDALHARWPAARLFVTRVYRETWEIETTLYDDTWIPNVLAPRSAFAFVGPDERMVFPGHTTDLTHPDATGYALFASALKVLIGY